MRLKIFFRKFVLILPILVLVGCHGNLVRQTVPAEIQRTAEMPLVVAIPGLNLPPFADSRIHFGDLNKIMDKKGIPSVTVAYDSTSDPVPDVADLSSQEHAMAVMRVLPRLSTVLSEENEVRRRQNLPPLENLDLLTYSQGSVVVWDLIKRLSIFEDRLDSFVEKVGDEWERFKNEPVYGAMNDAILNFFLIYNVKMQDPEAFKKYIDLQNIYFRAGRNLDKAIDRWITFMWPKDKAEPYPKIAKWVAKHYPKPTVEGDISKDIPKLMSTSFFVQYAAFKNMLPLHIRVFSIAGSFLGSPQAFAGYFYSEYFPWLAQPFVKNRQNQIKDTRLGSRHHLEWTKTIIKRLEQERRDQRIKEVYYVVGVNGLFDNKGDGLVEQPSAHLSAHRLVEIPVGGVLEKINNNEPLSFEWYKIPQAPVIGLPVKHLPERAFFRKIPGAAQITPKNEVYPFFMAFLDRDPEAMKKLFNEEHEPLRQFMISVYLTDVKDLKRKNLKVKSLSKEIKIGKKRYENRDSNSVSWIGHFKDDNISQADVLLEISKGKNKTEMVFPVFPGRTHFIDIIPEAEEELKAA